MLVPLQRNEAVDPLRRRPPQDAALDEAATERAEMRARQLFPLCGVHAGKAFLQVDARNAAPLRDQPEHEGADRVANRRYGAKRKKVHEPHEPEHHPAEQPLHCGLAPLGTL